MFYVDRVCPFSSVIANIGDRFKAGTGGNGSENIGRSRIGIFPRTIICAIYPSFREGAASVIDTGNGNVNSIQWPRAGIGTGSDGAGPSGTTSGYRHCY